MVVCERRVSLSAFSGTGAGSRRPLRSGLGLVRRSMSADTASPSVPC